MKSDSVPPPRPDSDCAGPGVCECAGHSIDPPIWFVAFVAIPAVVWALTEVAWQTFKKTVGKPRMSDKRGVTKWR